MALFLEVVESSQSKATAGERFLVRAGATIGRRGTDFVIDDSKISSKHAMIESRADGYYVVDAGSSNGIRLGGSKTKEVQLFEGVQIQLGRTVLQVVEADIEPSSQVPGSWIPAVIGLLRRARKNARNEPVPLSPFDPPLLLRVIQGRQTGVEWMVGYGPRDAGSASVDLRIEEPNAPALCFRLIPAGANVSFKTEHPNIVRLNGQEIAGAPVGDGDIIDIENTRIQVRVLTNASLS